MGASAGCKIKRCLVSADTRHQVHRCNSPATPQDPAAGSLSILQHCVVLGQSQKRSSFRMRDGICGIPVSGAAMCSQSITADQPTGTTASCTVDRCRAGMGPAPAMQMCRGKRNQGTRPSAWAAGLAGQPSQAGRRGGSILSGDQVWTLPGFDARGLLVRLRHMAPDPRLPQDVIPRMTGYGDTGEGERGEG